MAKFYTCRTVVKEQPFALDILCLKPTVNDRQCMDCLHEQALEDNRRKGWPFWP